MTGIDLPMILDAIVILLLAGTIFYAIRLSSHIQDFRDSLKWHPNFGPSLEQLAYLGAVP